MRILLYKSNGLISSLIKWQTRSEYSHAAVLFTQTNILFESHFKTGVHLILNPTFTETIDVFKVKQPVNIDAAFKFANDQIGKSYDLGSVLRFVSRRQETRKSKGLWFCSEYVFVVVQKGGVDLLCRCEPWEVSPEGLSLSPLLEYEKTIQPTKT